MSLLRSVVAAVCLACCGWTPGVAAEIHSIAIASPFARSFTLLHFGTLRFNNKNDSADVPDWNLDGFIEAKLKTALKDRYAVSILPRQSNDNTGNVLNQTAGQYDAYLLITSGRRENTIGHTDTPLEGVGIHQKNIFGSN